MDVWTRSTTDGYNREARNGYARRFQDARSRGRKPVTPNQVKSIRSIARSQNTDLEELLRQEFDAAKPEDLTVKQAWDMIDLHKNSERT